MARFQEAACDLKVYLKLEYVDVISPPGWTPMVSASYGDIKMHGRKTSFCVSRAKLKHVLNFCFRDAASCNLSSNRSCRSVSVLLPVIGRFRTELCCHKYTLNVHCKNVLDINDINLPKVRKGCLYKSGQIHSIRGFYFYLECFRRIRIVLWLQQNLWRGPYV